MHSTLDVLIEEYKTTMKTKIIKEDDEDQLYLPVKEIKKGMKKLKKEAQNQGIELEEKEVYLQIFKELVSMRRENSALNFYQKLQEKTLLEKLTGKEEIKLEIYPILKPLVYEAVRQGGIDATLPFMDKEGRQENIKDHPLVFINFPQGQGVSYTKIKETTGKDILQEIPDKIYQEGIEHLLTNYSLEEKNKERRYIKSFQNVAAEYGKNLNLEQIYINVVVRRFSEDTSLKKLTVDDLFDEYKSLAFFLGIDLNKTSIIQQSYQKSKEKGNITNAKILEEYATDYGIPLAK